MARGPASFGGDPIRGVVTEGCSYDSQCDWSKEAEKFGYTPYIGTLNVTIEEPLYPDGGILTINSFAAFPGTINGAPCHIMCKTYDDYDRRRVFVLAAERLRDKLGLVDGSEVDLQFDGEGKP